MLIIWDNFADYHYARLAAATHALSGDAIWVRGVELVGIGESHGWAGARHVGNVVRVSRTLPRSVSAWIQFVIAVAWRLHGEKPLLAFIPSYSPARPLALLIIARLLGIPVVMMNESHAGTAGTGFVRGPIKRLVVKQFAAALLSGGPQKRYFASLGMPLDRMSSGYSSIDGAALREAACSRDWIEQCEAKFRAPVQAFLSLGRLVEKKNHTALIDGYAILNHKYPRALPPLLIVGNGENEQKICERARAHGIAVLRHSPADDFRGRENCICLYPFCSNREAAYFYSRAIVFILASTREEWGLVVNEAIACMVPVVVSQTAGCSEDLVTDGKNGYTFSPTSAHELASRLEALWQRTDLRSAMRSAAGAMHEEVDINQFGRGVRRLTLAILSSNRVL